MKKILVLALALGLTSHALGKGRPGKWTFSGGLGLTASPTLLLVTPQFEIQHSPILSYGPMMQLGLGDTALFTGSAVFRFKIGHHPKIRPNIEAGLGIAAASGFSNSVGLHVMFGMGADYIIDRSLSLGTVVRVNFAPPIKGFFLSWPLIIARLRL